MNYEFDIAISFAGEDRPVADEIARKLRDNGIKVFYDVFEEATLWGKDLYEHLHNVYSKNARFCVMLLSEHYARKAWTNHERKSAQERAFKESEEYVLPVKLDDTSIPGIRETIGYLSLRNKTTDDVVNAVLQKLGKGKTNPGNPEPYISKPTIALPTVKKTFTERDKDIFIDTSFATIRAYFKEGIRQLNTLQDTEADFKEITSHKFICKVYVEGKKKSSCTIWLGSQFMSNGINYSNEANPDAGSSLNDSLTINTDNVALFFKPLMNFSGHNVPEKMDANMAAVYYWTKLIGPLNS